MEQSQAAPRSTPTDDLQQDDRALCTIAVSNLAGEVLHIEVPEAMRIHGLKREIEKEWKVAVSNQTLLCGTLELLDSEVISSFAARDCVRLTLVIEMALSGRLSCSVDDCCRYNIQAVVGGVHGDTACRACLSMNKSSDPLDHSHGISLFRPNVSEAGSHWSMCWRILQLEDTPYFRVAPCGLETRPSGVLDQLNPSQQPCFRAWGNYTGQRWKFEEVEGGYAMSTLWTPHLFLTFNPVNERISMHRWGEQGVQVWSVRRCRHNMSMSESEALQHRERFFL